MNLNLARRAQRGMSLLAMLCVVIIVGGISSAFFLLSMTERQQSDVIRLRTKSYYLGEAAVERVASMLKSATSSTMPYNPYSNAGAPLATTTPGTGAPAGTGTPVTDGTLTANWAWWYITASGVWVPATATNVSSARVNSEGPDRFQLRLDGNITIVTGEFLSETFAFNVVNFQNTAPGGGPGNTAGTNFYSISVDGKAKNLDTAGSKSAAAKGTQVKITRELELNTQSLLPFFAFYDGDLEFLPGPRFVGNGKIHTNNDLYLGGGTSIDMNTNYIGAAKQIYRHRKENGSYTQNSGPVTIHNAFAPGYTPAAGELNTGPAASWSGTLESYVGGQPNNNWGTDTTSAGLFPTVKNGDTGAQPISTPPVGSIQPPPAGGGAGGNYFEWATNPTSAPNNSVQTGLVLTVNSSGAVTAKYNSGAGQVDVTSALISAGAITPNQSIADNRQSTTAAVPTTVVNMGKLRTSGYLPTGGILYATDARNGAPTRDSNGNLNPPAAPTLPAGFVFENGKNLSDIADRNGQGINIVSNGPVYVKGDFNAPDMSPTGPRDPVSGRPYQPVNAGIISDAVNLLSNNWGVSTTKTVNGAPPTATETNYNFAMITGNVPTAGTQYSGGLENLPRFHENWAGVNCNYRGALINLWASNIAKGVWGQNNVYSPPNRNWDWDSAFGATSPPAKIPGFPTGVTINRTIYMMDYWGAGGSGGYRSAQ